MPLAAEEQAFSFFKLEGLMEKAKIDEFNGKAG